MKREIEKEDRTQRSHAESLIAFACLGFFLSPILTALIFCDGIRFLDGGPVILFVHITLTILVAVLVCRLPRRGSRASRIRFCSIAIGISILICFGLVLNDVPLIVRIQRDEKDLLDLRNAGVGNAHPGQVGSFHIYSAHVSEDGMLILTTDYELKNAMGLVHSPNKGFPRDRLRHLYGGWYRYWE